MRQTTLPFFDHRLAVFAERSAHWFRDCTHLGLSLVFGVLLALPAFGDENAPTVRVALASGSGTYSFGNL